MDVSIVDYYANHGTSFLHKAKAGSKMIFVALVIASIILTNDFYLLCGIYTTLAALAVWTRLPVIKIIMIAAYPAIFALIFVIASWDGSWMKAGIIILKALSSALAMVILIVTTPYPNIFSGIKPLVPKIISEALFLTYRSIFILFELTDGLIKGLRVRGGLSHRKYAANIMNFSSGIGLLLVRGIDLSEKFYGVMNVRGYNGSFTGSNNGKYISLDNILMVLFGVGILVVTLGIRYKSGLTDLSVYIFAFSICLAVTSIVYKHFND